MLKQLTNLGGVILKSLFRIKKIKVGFSLILADEIVLEEGAHIGHLNCIICRKLVLKKGASIGKLNFIKGNFDLLMYERSDINMQNKITSILKNELKRGRSELQMKYHAKIGVGHLIDMTSNITIGENSMIAGAGSQLWTHGFYFSKVGDKVSRIDGDIAIGNNCYIGARSVICAGVSIPAATTIGANCCISKSLEKSGLYVSQPLRYIEFDPDVAINRFGTPEDCINGVNIYRKC